MHCVLMPLEILSKPECCFTKNASVAQIVFAVVMVSLEVSFHIPLTRSTWRVLAFSDPVYRT